MRIFGGANERTTRIYVLRRAEVNNPPADVEDRRGTRLQFSVGVRFWKRFWSGFPERLSLKKDGGGGGGQPAVRGALRRLHIGGHPRGGGHLGARGPLQIRRGVLDSGRAGEGDHPAGSAGGGQQVHPRAVPAAQLGAAAGLGPVGPAAALRHAGPAAAGRDGRQRSGGRTAVRGGLRHRLVRLHYNHAELQAAGWDAFLLPEPVRAGILHPASDRGHGGVPDRPARLLWDHQLRGEAGRGDGVFRLVHLRIHGLPVRQPACQPQGSGGLSRLPLLLCDRLDGPDLLSVEEEGTVSKEERF